MNASLPESGTARNENLAPESHFVCVDGLDLHYLACGEGPALLLVHGWPTSSHLWRNIMPGLAENHRVIALDLPGFGQSAKPVDQRYDFDFYCSVISGFLQALNIERTGIVVHDLGGPVGLMWAVRNPQMLRHITVLNTLVYPQTSLAVKLFLAATRLPLIRRYLTSSRGLVDAMKLGVCKRENLNREVLTPYVQPFESDEARLALLRTAQGMSVKQLARIAKELPGLDVPIRLAYGNKDRILPDIAKTMARLQADIPSAELSVLEGCGHFLQEDEPEQLTALIKDFVDSVDYGVESTAS